MQSYLVKTPKLVQQLFSKRVWSFPKKTNTVYLTFDDGPIPQITPWVLDTLKQHQAKATFFCIGENIKKHPEILKTIILEGHTIGNHTYNHLNGWKTNTKDYTINTEEGQQIINSEISNFNNLLSTINNPKSSIPNLFRPPFGKITSKQSKILQEKGYKIIMWDVLSADFDSSISKEKCLENVLNNIQEGSIVVFHDSLKAEEKLKYVLPKVLEYISTQKWKCAKI